MLQTLLFCHSLIRWFVLIALVYAIIKSYKGYFNNLEFSKTDNLVRHLTATIAHIQLIIGIVLYSESSAVKYFWQNLSEALASINTIFFSLIHITLMFLAIIVITIGSASAKRKLTDKEKFKTMLICFSVALLIICIAIPWPFSPFATRPYIR